MLEQTQDAMSVLIRLLLCKVAESASATEYAALVAPGIIGFYGIPTWKRIKHSLKEIEVIRKVPTGSC